jgi:hypothetical protein
MLLLKRKKLNCFVNAVFKLGTMIIKICKWKTYTQTVPCAKKKIWGKKGERGSKKQQVGEENNKIDLCDVLCLF